MRFNSDTYSIQGFRPVIMEGNVGVHLTHVLDLVLIRLPIPMFLHMMTSRLSSGVQKTNHGAD